MKNNLLALFLMICCATVNAQTNLELVGQLSYPQRLNDIWGYTAPDGTEYALVGLREGVSIVSLADPSNPTEVALIEGQASVWRDLKTWNQHAYVTTDDIGGTTEGLLVIDLSNLPNEVSFFKWTPHLPALAATSNGEDTLYTCHNLYIDEFGYCYLSGCNLNEGGILILDVFSTPGQPIYVAAAPNVYSHDVFTRENLMYSSEILEGEFTIFDVTDKEEIIELGSFITPFEFTHNAWLSDDGSTLFTTDERANASTAAYDVSDPLDPRYLDEYRPAETIGTGVIPHNVHVLGDYLVISHYSDGCKIVDATRPNNLVEVGSYDTYTASNTGFNGAWGAYPFLPSGLILVSDITNGLFVLNPTYERAAYLEGKITNANSEIPIVNATVTLVADAAIQKRSDLGGNYNIGRLEEGQVEVVVQAIGFFDKTVEATLTKGTVTNLDVALDPLPELAISGRVVQQGNGAPIEGAKVFFEGTQVDYETTTDADGQFSFPEVYQGIYHIYIGAWGYENVAEFDQILDANANMRYELGRIYEDNFNVDLGWTEKGSASRGDWVRGVPVGTFWNGQPVQANADSEDAGTRCYITRNGSFDGKGGDIDEGNTILTSPFMDLTTYIDPVLSYQPWFVNLPIEEEFVQPDSMIVRIHNGQTTAIVEIIDDSRAEWRAARSISISELIDITDSMQVSFEVFDRFLTDDIADGGLDNFRVSDGIPESAFAVKDQNVEFGIFPNPFQNEFTLIFRAKSAFATANAVVYNALGQEMFRYPLVDGANELNTFPAFAAAVYFVIIELDGIRSEAMRIVKQ